MTFCVLGVAAVAVAGEDDEAVYRSVVGEEILAKLLGLVVGVVAVRSNDGGDEEEAIVAPRVADCCCCCCFRA